MADTRLASGRLLSQWQSCDPDFMSQMSKAAVFHALNDAKADILALAVRVAELERASQTDEDMRDLYAAGWAQCAKWANRVDLIADIGSPAYERDKGAAIAKGE